MTLLARAHCVEAMFSALTEFERNIIRERTLVGLAAAKARGRIGGRCPRNASPQQEH